MVRSLRCSGVTSGAELNSLTRNFCRVSTILATLMCFCAGLGSSIITGGLDPMAAHFHVTSEIINLSCAVLS